MSEITSISEQQTLLVIKKQVADRMDRIIPEMQALAKKYQRRDERSPRSPFHNVLNVATELESSIEITKNFILYQLGRSSSGGNQIWSRPVIDGKPFAIALVDAIDGLEKEAKEIVQTINETLNTELDEQWVTKTHRHLMQLYLGYLTRYQAYLAKDRQKEST